MVIQISQKRILVAIVSVVLILSSGHVLQSVWDPIRQIPLLTAAAFLLLMPRSFLRQKWNIALWAFAVLLLMVLASMVSHLGSGTLSYVRMACMILTAYGITMLIPFHRMVEYYLKLMTAVSVAALIGYFLSNYTSVLNVLPQVTNFNNRVYRIGLIFNYMVTIPERNCGMFWEPGLFATALIFALLLELLFKEGKVKPLRIILYTACIFTANSSAGFVLWILCMLIFLLRNSSMVGKNVIVKVIAPLLLTVLIAVILNLDTIIMETGLRHNQYVQKLLSNNISQSSRVFAITHNLSLFAKHPLFGAGIVETAYHAQRYADTSTTTYLMCEYGILGLSYTIFWIIGIFRQKGINVFCKILVLAIILSIINKEPHGSIMFSWCFMFYLLREKNHQITAARNPVAAPLRQVTT